MESVVSRASSVGPADLWCTLCPLPESASGGDGFGLRQDRQERRHRQSLCGLQQHRRGAATLVRHAGQPPATHRPVAHSAGRGGG